MPWPTVPVVTTGMDQDTDTLPRSDILDLTTKFNQLIVMRGVADGVCDLDGFGKVPNARLDETLVAIAGLATGADFLPYSTGTDTFAQTAFTPFSRTVLDDVDAPAWRATLGVVAATDLAAGLIELATNAEVTAGTDAVRAVTPAGLRGGLNATGAAPVYACRAWVNFNGANGAINAGGNVSSVTRTAVGEYTITFTTALQDANYAVNYGCENESATFGNTRAVFGVLGGRLAGSLKIYTAYPTGTSGIDLPGVYVGIFR